MSREKQGEIKQCLNCGKDEYVPQYRLKTYKFCSRSCSYHWKAKNDTVQKSCHICNSEFTVIKHREKTAKYCSRQCYYKSLHQKGNTTYKCIHCGVDFIGHKAHKRKYCSKSCVNKSSKETFKPKFTTVRKSMIARGLINKCERCGFDAVKEILGVHHKDRNRNNNELSNLEVLCPNCHSIEHSKHTPHGFKE
jgi:hypothetical protein